MSQHAIEDLVEETIRLVDGADAPGIDKTGLIRGLLALQARYDTSLTWFRLPDILIRRDVLRRQPLAEIIDAPTQVAVAATRAPGWAVDANGDPLGYVRHEGGQPILYRLTDPQPPAPCAELFLAIAKLADLHDDTRLFTDWYGLMVRAWADHALDQAHGFPRQLAALAQQPALCAIRDIAVARKIKRRRGAPDELMLPRLSDELSDDVEHEYGLRFFLDLGKSVDALRKALAKAEARQQVSAVLIPELVDAQVGQRLLHAGWRPRGDAGVGHWLWRREVGAQHQVVWCEFDEKVGMLLCLMGLQHRLLLNWQQRAPSEHLHELHFYQAATHTMPEAVRNSDKVNGFGGWKLDPGKSAKLLTASMTELAELLPPALDAWFVDVERQFPDAFFQQDVDELIDQMVYGVGGTGVVPDHVLFSNPDSLLLAFAYHHRDRGDTARADAMIARVRQRLAARSRSNAWTDRYLTPVLDAWAAGRRDLPMPPLLHMKLAMHLG